MGMAEPRVSTLFLLSFIIFSFKLNGSFVLLAGPRTEIQFVCNASASFANLKFLKKLGETYIFEVETPLACKAWPYECMVGCLTTYMHVCIDAQMCTHAHKRSHKQTKPPSFHSQDP